jgi:hypothetical protein
MWTIIGLKDATNRMEEAASTRMNCGDSGWRMRRTTANANVDRPSFTLEHKANYAPALTGVAGSALWLRLTLTALLRSALSFMKAFAST